MTFWQHQKQYCASEAGTGGSATSKRVRGTVLYNEPLRKHTTWRVGGPADVFFKPADLDDVVEFLKQTAANEPIFWLGLGSNLLVRDGGLRGTVIATSGLLNQLQVGEDNLIYAQAGVACNKVAKFAAKHNLVGGEFLAGIPGTIGGALAMNAGAFGSETWTFVAEVETINRYGERFVRKPEEFEIGYRHVRGPANEWFVGARFRFAPGDGKAASANIKNLLAKRSASQPTNLPNCGSVFRNPPGDYAGRLVESAGLKGFCIGGACVSEKHANFIVNTGAATAADIEAVIQHVVTTVKQVHGVDLIREVHIVGEAKEHGIS
jgi:UDP-N-acetylmuramate dehydrogenase